MRIPLLAAAVWMTLPVFSVPGRAQLAPSPDAPPVSNAPEAPAEDQSVATFKIQVNLVDLFFTVKDKSGNLVPHLTEALCG